MQDLYPPNGVTLNDDNTSDSGANNSPVGSAGDVIQIVDADGNVINIVE